ncbi:sugar ABC transporter substrate-binding protein [Treponema sp. HNW]|uniref:sugar ABC transporter substrate-binding protein n=1 Tax=Treponema sp. HNW TaxID=3116654 RepID=UPI003D0F8DDF
MKKILGILVLFCLVVSTIVAGGKTEKENKPLNIVLIYHDTALEFGQVIKAGAMAAGKDLNCNVKFEGPVGIKVDEHVAFIENAITRKVDGIATSNPNGEALNPMIKKALDAGIPTITFNSEAENSPSKAFVGQGLVESGRQLAHVTAEYIGKKGTVIIITGEAAATWSIDRETGFREAMASYPGVKILNTVSTGWEEQAQYAAIENAILANPNLSAVASLDGGTTPTTGVVLSRLNRRDIVHVGNDLTVQTLDNIKAGWTKASLSQFPFNQGYMSVKILYDFITNGTPLKSVDTGILRVDEKNIDEYMKKLVAGEPVG